VNALMRPEPPHRRTSDLNGESRQDLQSSVSTPPAESAGVTAGSEEQLDAWRILLIDLVYLLSAYFVDVRYWQGVKTEKDTFQQLARTLGKLSRLPGNDGTVLIRYRGFPSGKKGSEKSDYQILFAGITVDTATANAITARQGIHMSHMAGRLTRSFAVLADHGIDTLYLRIPSAAGRDLERLRVCLHVISHYRLALKQNGPIVIQKKGGRITLPLLYNEQNQPDLNLVLLAALNELTPRTAERLVRRVIDWMQNTEAISATQKNAGVYNLIFQAKNLKDRLVRPPIEINNVRWLKLDAGQRVATERRSPDTAEEDIVPQAFRDAFGEMLPEGDEVPDDWGPVAAEQVDPELVGRRLQQAFDLMEAVETRSEGREILEEVIQSIQGRFETAGEDVFDSMEVHGDVLKVMAEGKEIVIEGLDHDLLEKIVIHKDRNAHRRQMRALCGGAVVDFESSQYAHLAADIGMTPEDIEKIVELLQGCFDGGHFLRPAFERNLAEFTRYPDRVFVIFWQYLKRPLERKERVAFLNALQQLVLRMQSEAAALDVLLADFFQDPAAVAFSDRNALLFASLLLRKFNKEMNLEIEITPEEVLQVRKGLDAERVEHCRQMISTHSTLLLEKVQTIQQQIETTLAGPSSSAEVMPLRYLLSLERELVIFLSLVGGDTALAVVREALKRYGHPASEIYHQKESRSHIAVLLQHLKVIIRCLGRIGEKEDLSLLEDVKNRRRGFLRLGEGLPLENLVERIPEWVNFCRQCIYPPAALDLPPISKP